jgi:hypothetical protein
MAHQWAKKLDTEKATSYGICLVGAVPRDRQWPIKRFPGTERPESATSRAVLQAWHKAVPMNSEFANAKLCIMSVLIEKLRNDFEI